MLRVLPGNQDAPKTGQEQTAIPPGLVTSHAAMFAAPGRSSQQNPQVSTSPMAPVASTQPKRALPNPPQPKIDLSKALNWIKIFDAHVTSEQHEEVINDIKNGELNLLEKGENGLNFLHSAASNGSTEFFNLIRSIPDVWARVKDHINDYSDEHCTVLGYAIKAHQYDLALKLIQNNSADYNALVHDPTCGQADRSASMLRLTLASVFIVTSKFSSSQKQSFDNLSGTERLSFSLLVDELLERGLKFFHTPDSSRPPVSELLVDRFGTEEVEKKDTAGQIIKICQRKKYFYDLMTKYGWDEKKDIQKAIIVSNLRTVYGVQLHKRSKSVIELNPHQKSAFFALNDAFLAFQYQCICQ